MDKQLEKLKQIIKEDHYSLTGKGEYCDEPEGRYETIHSETSDSGRWMEYIQEVTRLPDGRLFSWTWARGLTEMQENEAPGEYGSIDLVEMEPKEITVTTYVVKEKDQS